VKLQELTIVGALQISSSAMIIEAGERMKALGTDVLAVVENRQIVGIVAEWDVVPEALPSDMDPRFTPIRSVMTCEPACCSQEDDIDKAIEIMETSHAQRLIVLDSRGQAVGVLLAEDLTSKAGEHSHTRSLMEGENHESPRD
jgi:signal-transduction protein with cAMP-binding, CBS, and nucleotidyltransferase domain